ncbi:alanine racemase [Gulosibacter molinativorax]|uniref:Alanine racemase C-terminal domain-containing protein n=1 Tax=Gulosibacter molinativorax TaxID=256821 RepID=A0ABT7C4M2_9MICO|nr:alanine racemase [Gulosibacter molinativorax]MDJ1370157.1 hypothetical protein [Gulosibacter molinativorax]QUY61568.1 Alanine racemase [Gulosibacter molinativorax]
MSESLANFSTASTGVQDSGGFRLLELTREAAVQLTAWRSGELPAVPTEWWDGRVRLSAELLTTKAVAAGAGVSYGHRYRTAEPTSLGLIGIGYGFGLPRCAGGAASVAVTVGEERVLVPIVGRVAMNAAVLDLGSIRPETGSLVEVIGPATSLTEWTRWTDMSAEALIAGLANLVETRILDIERLGARAPEAGLPEAGASAAGEPAAGSAGPIVEVDTDALAANIALMRERVAPSQLWAVVKADAYGHDLDIVIPVMLAGGIEGFAVADLATAARVRKLAPDARILAWMLGSGADFRAAIAAGVELGVTDLDVYRRVVDAAAELGQPTQIHLSIDTGLHRDGFLYSSFAEHIPQFASDTEARRIRVMGSFTHLAETTYESDSEQLARFADVIASLDAAGLVGEGFLRHAQASAASYTREDGRLDLVRIGAFLYGVAPGDGIGPQELGLRPVMTVTAPVVTTNLNLDGASATAIGIGSSHGVLEWAAGRTSLMLGGERRAILRVEANRTFVEAGDGDALGQRAVLVGNPGRADTPNAPVLQELQDAMDTIGEEITCRIDPALPRVSLP